MNTLKAIAAVQADLSQIGIDKGSRNEFHKFNFRGIDQVQQTLSPLLAKHGLVIMPHVLDRIVTQQETQKGGSQTNVALRIEYVFRHVSSTIAVPVEIAVAPDRDYAICTVWGEATDTADKATSKAMSMAYKYMVFQVFCPPLEGADDPDADSPEPAATQPTQRMPERFSTEGEAMSWLNTIKSKLAIQAWGQAVKASFTDTEVLDRLRGAVAQRQVAK